MRELIRFTPEQRLAAFVFASFIRNCRRNQHQQLDLLAIASQRQINLYAQECATVELKP
ncbi:MAG: hypothetical protein KAF91_05325 [Nostoc sp. TH1S01]|nr:hypothetical protein [Nostoc sp. TH1S01]